MAGKQIIDEVADDGIWLISQLGYHAADQRPTASMPLEINGTVKVSRAVDLRPTVRPAGLFRPDFNKLEFLFQLRIAHDLVPQRSAASCDDLNHRLHRPLGSTALRVLQRRCAKVERALRRSTLNFAAQPP